LTAFPSAEHAEAPGIHCPDSRRFLIPLSAQDDSCSALLPVLIAVLVAALILFIVLVLIVLLILVVVPVLVILLILIVVLIILLVLVIVLIVEHDSPSFPGYENSLQ